jgi:hypothetical protein
MTRKLLLPLALIGVTAMGVFATSGIGSEDRSVPQATELANGYRSADAEVHRVARPSPGANTSAVVAAKKKRKKVKIQYFETGALDFIADPDAFGLELTCPGKRRVLGGYFGADGVDAALTFSAPVSPKSWFVGVTKVVGDYGPLADPSGEASAAFLGIVCAKGVK